MSFLSEGQRRCSGCGSIYEWRKSSSRSLKMTYCTFSCERLANGCLIEDFDNVYRVLVFTDAVVGREVYA